MQSLPGTSVSKKRRTMRFRSRKMVLPICGEAAQVTIIQGITILLCLGLTSISGVPFGGAVEGW